MLRCQQRASPGCIAVIPTSRTLGRAATSPASPLASPGRRRRPAAALPTAALLLPPPLLADATPLPPLLELAEGLEAPVQLLYLATLLGFLSVGAFLVVRQVLVRRELEEAAKVLGDRIRAGEATSEDYFELGVILLRKKLYTQATKNLETARKEWAGEPEELAQVRNALGYSYFNMDKVEMAIAEYEQAVELQPGYVTAWNNLGDAYERRKAYDKALNAYTQALAYAPDNKVAAARADFCRTRIDRRIGS